MTTNNNTHLGEGGRNDREEVSSLKLKKLRGKDQHTLNLVMADVCSEVEKINTPSESITGKAKGE